MSGVAVRVDLAGFTKLEARIIALQVAVPKAIAQGLNEGGDKVRTQVMRALWAQTGAKKYQSITSRVTTIRGFAEGDRIAQSAPGHAGPNAPAMTYQIVAHGPAMKIQEVGAKVRLGKGGGVTATPWNTLYQFKRSFQAKDGRLLARVGDARFPLQALKGPNLAKELYEGAVPSVFIFSSHMFVGEAILKKLARVL